MNVFPPDAAEELKKCALAAGNSTANERFGTKGNAAAQKVSWGQNADAFKKKMNQFLSADICNDFKMMFWYQAWRTANERKGYKSDAARDIKDVQTIYDRILSRRELTTSLAEAVHSMGWNVAWYCANTKRGFKDDAIRDKANYEADYSKIAGEVNLVAMNFNTDKAKVIAEKPKIIAEETLVNKGTITQQMEFSFSVTEGKTESTTHQIGFQYGVKVGFEATFSVFAKATVEASFQFSHSHTWAESTTNGTTKSYRFPLSVPPRSTYTAKAMVHEADMEIPYELVFDFSGIKKSVTGIWKGVAVSTATCEINPV